MAPELEKLFIAYPALEECRQAILRAYGVLEQCFAEGGRLYLCGNGGSAADCEHIVGELIKQFKIQRNIDPGFVSRYVGIFNERPPAYLTGALPATSLVSQTSYITAFINDESEVGVFAQQVYAYGRTGDVLLAISTSGSSKNVIEAVKVALALGMRVIGMTGSPVSPLDRLCTVCIRVPATETYAVQELHLPVYHALCAALEEHYFGKGSAK